LTSCSSKFPSMRRWRYLFPGRGSRLSLSWKAVILLENWKQKDLQWVLF